MSSGTSTSRAVPLMFSVVMIIPEPEFSPFTIVHLHGTRTLQLRRNLTRSVDREVDQPGAAAPRPHGGRSSWPTRSGWTCSRSGSTTGPTSWRRRRRWCWRPMAVRTRRHPAHERGDGAELRRSGAGVPGVRDGGPAVGRPGGDHGGAGLVHGVVSAVRLQPGRLRRPLRREAAAAAPDTGERGGDLEGAAPRGAQRPGGVSAAAAAAAAGVDRGGRESAVGGAGRDARACRWRWRSSAARRSGSCRWWNCIATRRGRRGTIPPRWRVSINSHAFVADTSQEAADRFYPLVCRRDVEDRAGAWLAADEPRRSTRRSGRRAAHWRWAARRK